MFWQQLLCDSHRKLTRALVSQRACASTDDAHGRSYVHHIIYSVRPMRGSHRDLGFATGVRSDMGLGVAGLGVVHAARTVQMRATWRGILAAAIACPMRPWATAWHGNRTAARTCPTHHLTTTMRPRKQVVPGIPKAVESCLWLRLPVRDCHVSARGK